MEIGTLKILENLKKALMEYDADATKKWAEIALEKQMDPVKAADALTEGIREVGEGFARGDFFLPDLIMAAEAMKSALTVLTEEIKRRGQKRKVSGTVVIGTVKGDIHDIGKTIVATLLYANGFEVIDLGVDIPIERFMQAAREFKPDMLAMSALLTATAPEQLKVIKALKNEGLREKVKVIVGGGAITEAFAKQIGADGYGADGFEAVEKTKELLRMK